MRMVSGLSLMRSPLGRQRVQLSSSTASREKAAALVVDFCHSADPTNRHKSAHGPAHVDTPVFMFSIHTGSTGPSNTTHLRSRVVSDTAARMMDDASPSVHSLVSRLYSPYSSPMLMHLGLSVNV